MRSPGWRGARSWSRGTAQPGCWSGRSGQHEHSGWSPGPDGPGRSATRARPPVCHSTTRSPTRSSGRWTGGDRGSPARTPSGWSTRRPRSVRPCCCPGTPSGRSAWTTSVPTRRSCSGVAAGLVPTSRTASRPCLSVVGARSNTLAGAEACAEITSAAADAGCTTVSGGAYGIDAVAHRVAIAAGAPTVAVLAGGIDQLYPAGTSSCSGTSHGRGSCWPSPRRGPRPPGGGSSRGTG